MNFDDWYKDIWLPANPGGKPSQGMAAWEARGKQKRIEDQRSQLTPAQSGLVLGGAPKLNPYSEEQFAALAEVANQFNNSGTNMDAADFGPGFGVETPGKDADWYREQNAWNEYKELFAAAAEERKRLNAQEAAANAAYRQAMANLAANDTRYRELLGGSVADTAGVIRDLIDEDLYAQELEMLASAPQFADPSGAYISGDAAGILGIRGDESADAIMQLASVLGAQDRTDLEAAQGFERARIEDMANVTNLLAELRGKDAGRIRSASEQAAQERLNSALASVASGRRDAMDLGSFDEYLAAQKDAVAYSEAMERALEAEAINEDAEEVKKNVRKYLDSGNTEMLDKYIKAPGQLAQSIQNTLPPEYFEMSESARRVWLERNT